MIQLFFLSLSLSADLLLQNLVFPSQITPAVVLSRSLLNLKFYRQRSPGEGRFLPSAADLFFHSPVIRLPPAYLVLDL